MDEVELNLEGGYIQVQNRKVNLTIRNMFWNPGTFKDKLGLVFNYLRYIFKHKQMWSTWLDAPMKYEIEGEQHIEVAKTDLPNHDENYYL